MQYFYKSGSDYSVIIIDSKSINNSRYLILTINHTYVCADEMTKKERNESYKNFSKEISKKDREFKVKEELIIPGTHTRNFIYLTNYWRIFLDRVIYIICIFLSFGQIFKIYISCFIAENNYNCKSNE